MSHTLSFLGLFRYICLTDMIKAKDGDFFISDWLRNRNTLEYIGVWEQMYNPNFNYGEFAIIKSNAGLNNFKISVKEGGRTGARLDVVRPLWGRFLPPVGCPQVP